nr:solute carrier family 23 protein [Marinithermofilum abyssi]
MDPTVNPGESQSRGAIGIGGLFNAFPYTTFFQNVGLVALTRVKTRAVVIWAGGLLMLGCLWSILIGRRTS